MHLSYTDHHNDLLHFGDLLLASKFTTVRTELDAAMPMWDYLRGIHLLAPTPADGFDGTKIKALWNETAIDTPLLSSTSEHFYLRNLTTLVKGQGLTDILLDRFFSDATLRWNGISTRSFIILPSFFCQLITQAYTTKEPRSIRHTLLRVKTELPERIALVYLNQHEWDPCVIDTIHHTISFGAFNGTQDDITDERASLYVALVWFVGLAGFGGSGEWSYGHVEVTMYEDEGNCGVAAIQAIQSVIASNDPVARKTRTPQTMRRYLLRSIMMDHFCQMSLVCVKPFFLSLFEADLSLLCIG